MSWNPMAQHFDPNPGTLGDFLLARIAEDDALARPGVTGFVGGPWALFAWGHEIDVNFARVLAECEAKRRIVAEHAAEAQKVDQSPFDPSTGERRPDEWDLVCRVCGWADDKPSGGCATVKLLALPYAGHPDYREEWRP